jgi:hypothetical protein
LTIDRWVYINAKDGIFYVTGTFYVSGYYSAAAAAVEAQTGKVKWEKYLALGDVGLPAASIQTVQGQTVQTVYASGGWYPSDINAGQGIVSLDAETGDELAADRAPGVGPHDPTVDEQYGLVWAGFVDADGMFCLCAWTTEALVKTHTIDLGGYGVLGSPTLGWGSHSGGIGQPAVFGVADQGGPSTASRVYAVNRSTGLEMWRKDLPAQVDYVSAAYSGGKLFISTFDRRTLVLDTYNDGKIVDILNWGDWTSWFSPSLEGSPVIAEVNDAEGKGHGVMYFFGEDGSVVALSTEGTNPPPQSFYLLVAADPLQIGLQSRSTVTATFVDNHMQPFAGAQVNFSCDAGSNQGYVSPTVASTDANGHAVTTFFSGKREGTVTVTATTSGAAAASVAITVRNGGTPAVGTIQGTVYDAASKPVKDATVTATGPVTKQVTTNKQGKYSIGSLPVGTYTVKGTKAGVGSATVSGVTVTAGQTTTVDLRLK